jgi:hypothetical protein
MAISSVKTNGAANAFTDQNQNDANPRNGTQALAHRAWNLGDRRNVGSDDALSIRTSSMRYGWVDAAAMAEIDRILAATVKDPGGPEFMALPVQVTAYHFA